MDATASQTTSLTIVYSAVYSDADQGITSKLRAIGFGWWIHRSPMMARKMFPFDGVIMMNYLTNPYNWKIMLPKASNYFAIGIVMVPSWGPCYRSGRRREILKRCPYFSRLYLGVDIDKSCTCAWPYICIYTKTYICIYSLLYGMCSYNSYRKCHQQFIYPNSANRA